MSVKQQPKKLIASPNVLSSSGGDLTVKSGGSTEISNPQSTQNPDLNIRISVVHRGFLFPYPPNLEISVLPCGMQQSRLDADLN